MESRQEFLEIINRLEKEKSDYLKKLFQNCREETIKSITYMKIPKDYPLIRAGEKCNKAYVILTGKASGIDLQAPGNSYVFMEYSGIDVMGDFELFGDIAEYRISIQTLTECEVLVVGAKVYLDWMTKDVNALFMRTRKLMRTLTNQTTDERKYLFLGCRERMILYLIDRYEKYGYMRDYTIQKKQTEIAEQIGFNVRTIQRAIQALENEKMVTSIAGRIHLTADQYLKLKKYTEEHMLQNL